jgi:hypothetical protein
MVINRKERFATEGIRFQRHNGDGTIPTAQRFLGFANMVNLFGVLENGKAPLTIKIDAEAAETKDVDFSAVPNLARVTVQQAIEALNGAGFTGIRFSVDAKTGRVKGAFNSGTFASVTLQIENIFNVPITIATGIYQIVIGGIAFSCNVESPINIADGDSEDLVFVSTKVGINDELPDVDDTFDIIPLFSSFTNDQLTATVIEAENGSEPEFTAKKVQVVGELAAALDFGQCVKHGGRGLEIISFFDDETISIGLPKDIKDKEEIDIEGAKGTITRMVIGAMLQGLSPVVTLKEKDYYLLNLVQGGIIDTENNTYNPPLSNESEHPTFYAEIYSPVYSRGSNKLSDMSGYEELLLRTMIGNEGDVPIDAKAWAQYAFNLVATEYEDETGKKYPAWQERTMTTEQFDGLKVKETKLAV